MDYKNEVNIITAEAKVLVKELTQKFVVERPDIPGVDADAQILIKTCALVAAAEMIVHATEKINEELFSTMTDEQSERAKKEIAAIFGEEEKKESWN